MTTDIFPPKKQYCQHFFLPATNRMENWSETRNKKSFLSENGHKTARQQHNKTTTQQHNSTRKSTLKSRKRFSLSRIWFEEKEFEDSYSLFWKHSSFILEVAKAYFISLLQASELRVEPKRVQALMVQPEWAWACENYPEPFFKPELYP